jgi:TetR/AcrR family transcriptional regulator
MMEKTVEARRHRRSGGDRRGSRRQPERSRNAILKAALAEFGREGLAGARMDAIAAAAGVNKALLYYYFADKEALYDAILDRFFEELTNRVLAVCNRPGTAGERFLAYARTHYDAIAESPYYAYIFMSELMSASRGGSSHLDRIFGKYMQPIGMRVLALVEEGVKRGEFRAVDPNQFIPSAIGSIVHYFLTAPLRERFMPERDSRSPRAIQQRRGAVLDFIAAALFADRDAGIKLASGMAEQPATTLCGEPVAKRRPGGQRPAVPPQQVQKQDSSETGAARPPQPAPKPAPGPTQATYPGSAQPSAQGGYKWMDRWFPDVETAMRTLAEEKRRHRRLTKPLRPETGKEGPQ